MKLWALAVSLFVLTACGDATTATTNPPLPSTTPPAAVATTEPPDTPPTTTTIAPPTTVAETTVVETATTIDTEAPVVVEVAYAGGAVDGPARIELEKGANLRLVVTSDVAEEVHVHGYDVFADVAAGGTVTLDLVASIQGIFEVELEESRTELLQLVVR